MSYSTILFDLDGTINESAPGIINSFRNAMNILDIPIHDDLDLNFVIGPPLSFSFRKLNVPESRINEAITTFRECYSQYGIFDASLYDGIVDTLKILNAKGKSIHIATSKVDFLTEKILEHYKIRNLFGFVAAATIDEKRVKKDEVISWALENIKAANKADILMIGDRCHDVEGALKNGIDCLGVLYGYGSKDELLNAGAKYLASTPKEILLYV